VLQFEENNLYQGMPSGVPPLAESLTRFSRCADPAAEAFFVSRSRWRHR